MWAPLRRTNYVERVVLVVSGACILVGIPLTIVWFVGGPALPHLWVTTRYLLNGVLVMLQFKLKIDTEDLWKRKK